ncbi:helicase-related protein [Halospina sp. K52047b]|uniref:helicase-related protein n=1 Tax=Halospina sp. K52047b TaxID=2614160 RepID=UPI00124AAC11|nr:helicase-related protein [Halospina sp. K52047b]KAA8980319.1 ATP-dependent RNA helicase [Halospina sp. K52047b]
MHPLPIDSHRTRFMEALQQGHAVVTADTGSGKSTRLPVWACEQGATLVIEPRRVACTALAGFLARQQGTALGEGIGYAVRFDVRCNSDTPLVFATPGMALRWLGEGGLRRFRTVVLDEFHERRWDTDLLLALLQHQGEHHLVVTSATFAAEAVARHLQAPLIEAEGRRFPVTLQHEAKDERQMPESRHLADRMARAIKRALSETHGPVLAFLPGRGEIRDTEQALGDPGVPVLTLHATVDAESQKAALAEDGGQRVILATNVAETSLTIPGVTAVVDSGLERRTHQRNGRTVLSLAAISQASADQRSGRAGRTEAGTAIRLWGRGAPLEATTAPEIQREELTELVLAAGCANAPAHCLSFPDPLPQKAHSKALEQLQRMGAVDEDGVATDYGQRLFQLPIDSFFAHLISAMPDADTQGAMADVTAALSTRPRLFRFPDREDQRRALGDWLPDPCDATTLIALLRNRPPAPLSVNNQARQEARQLAGRIRDALALPGIPDDPVSNPDHLRRAIARAAPELVFVRREKRRQAMGNDAREVLPDEASRLPEDAEAALVLDEHSTPGKRGHRQTITIATCLAPVPLAILDELDLGEVRFGEMRLEDGEPRVRRERLYANRVVSSEDTTPAGSELRNALAELILQGQLLTPVGDRVQADIQQWALYVALGHGEGEVPESAQQWLCQRLQALGVEEPGDESLLEPGDLAFEGIPEWERETFDRRYPRRISLGDLVMDVTYEPTARRITLDYRHGPRKTPPKRWELPSWKGWKIRYRRASKVVTVQ